MRGGTEGKDEDEDEEEKSGSLDCRGALFVVLSGVSHFVSSSLLRFSVSFRRCCVACSFLSNSYKSNFRCSMANPTSCPLMVCGTSLRNTDDEGDVGVEEEEEERGEIIRGSRFTHR